VNTLTTGGSVTGTDVKETCINPCTSRAHESTVRPAEREVLFGLSCVGVPEHANDGAGAVDNEKISCVPTLLAHSVLGPHAQRGRQGQRERKQAPPIRDGGPGGQLGRTKLEAEGRYAEVWCLCAILTGDPSSCEIAACSSSPLQPRGAAVN